MSTACAIASSMSVICNHYMTGRNKLDQQASLWRKKICYMAFSLMKISKRKKLWGESKTASSPLFYIILRGDQKVLLKVSYVHMCFIPNHHNVFSSYESIKKTETITSFPFDIQLVKNMSRKIENLKKRWINSIHNHRNSLQ